MEYCSYFIENRAIFGCYPQENIRNLERMGVRFFFDLTNKEEQEKLNKYITLYHYDNFPIKDRYIPRDIHEFCKFVVKIAHIINNLKDNEKVYVHCKGGHGRAGIVVCCLLSYMYNFPSEEAIRLTTQYHNNRTKMRDKWRRIGSPQTDKQKEFVIRMFKSVFVNGITVKNSFYFLSNNSRHSVVYNGTVYKNANICYYANTYPEKARELMCCANFHDFNRIVNTIENTCDNKDKREELLTNVLSYKLQTYNDVYGVLKKTFLRPIKYVEDGIDVGNIYVKLRHELLK